MKTSNKLLLGFIVLVFLVPIFTSFMLKSRIENNSYTVSLYPSNEYYKQGTFGNYKVIKIVNNSWVNERDKFICTLHYSPTNKYYFADESNDQGMFDSVDVKIKNDTLLIERFSILRGLEFLALKEKELLH